MATTQPYDVIIAGAGFAGLTLALKLPRHLRVLVLEKKTRVNAHAQTTGLITVTTKDLIGGLVDVDRHLTNRIEAICVLDPSFEQHFISRTRFPWIHSTNTPELLLEFARTCGENVTILNNAAVAGYTTEPGSAYPVVVRYVTNGAEGIVRGRFVVGADGVRSAVAQANPALSRNRRLLFAFERMYEGDCRLGDAPDRTVYHLWFGSFSLGYGGWIAPNFIDGKKLFRVGFATYSPDAEKARLLDRLVDILVDRGIIRLGDPAAAPLLNYGGYCPIGGVLRRIHDDHALLIGDAAGFCGPFSADGIKGAVVSGLVAAEVIPRHLAGDRRALTRFFPEVEARSRLLSYYRKQLRYRFLWDRMTSNSSFACLYRICEGEREAFLDQFCDAKDRQASLLKVLIKARHAPRLAAMGFNVAADLLTRRT